MEGQRRSKEPCTFQCGCHYNDNLGIGARDGGGGREGKLFMDAVAITAVGWVVVISLNLFTVVMSRRDKVGERLGQLEQRVARIEGHLRVGTGDVT